MSDKVRNPEDRFSHGVDHLCKHFNYFSLFCAQFRVSEPKKMYQISAGNDIAVCVCVCVCVCVRTCVRACVRVCVCVGKISEFS